MTALSEAQACVESAEANHLRLCQAKDQGESVDVALDLAYRRLVKAKELLAVVEADSENWITQ
jgi:hypothetical protein